MGWTFRLEHANAVAWLTAPTEVVRQIPLDLAEAHNLLMGIATKSSPEETGFFSEDRQWQESIHLLCQRYSRNHSWGTFVEDEVRDGLRNLRSHFEGFNLFALGIPKNWQDLAAGGPLTTFLRDGAFSSEEFGLFLLLEEGLSTVSLLAPFPALRLISGFPTDLPAVLFWSRNGSAALCGLQDARDLYHRLRHAIANIAHVNRILDDFMRDQTQSPVLLQLSDLHFGTEKARDSQNYLLQAVERVANERKISRTVITGDLFDNPNREHEVQFIGFRQRLHAVVGTDPIVIPGNHDQRAWLGMFRRQLRQAADLDWSSIVSDDELKMVFLCFDSSKEGKGARGRVSVQHRLDMAAAFDNLMNRTPSVREYLRLALVHHHPFSFDLPASGWWRVLERLGFKEEQFLRMDDAEEFVKWCATRDASIILHGHKHVPYATDGEVRVTRSDGTESTKALPSIGCGSSTGVGDLPMSMNLLTWFPKQKRWSASFLIDPGDGQGFAEERVEMKAVRIE